MNKPVFIFESSLFTTSGYGMWSLDLAKSLLRYNKSHNDKFDIKIVPTRWGGCPSKHSADDLSDEVEKELFKMVLRQQLTKQPEVYMKVSIPNEFNPHGKFNIGATASIETTIPIPEFIEGLNRMNVNFAMSTFGKEVLDKATFNKKTKDGQTELIKNQKPLEVIFWGADTTTYKKTDATLDSVEKIMADIKEDSCFLFVGQWTHANGLYVDRKDIGMLIKTFLNTFKGEKVKPALVLKTSGVSFSKIDKHDILNKLHAIKTEVGGDDLPEVYFIHGELSDSELNALMNHKKIKAHVSFTHGEGYGHPLLLASLSGKPMLVPDWSGHLDFLNKEYVNLLVGEVKQINPASANDWYMKESAWFYVNYDQAGRKMKGLMDPDVYSKLLVKADKLRIENEQKFSLQAMDSVFHSFLDKIPEFAVEQKIILPKLKKIELPVLKKVE